MQQISQQTREQAMRTTFQTPILVRDLPSDIRQEIKQGQMIDDDRLVKISIETIDDQTDFEEDKRIRQEIQEGLDAANRGEFTSREEMNALFRQHGVNVGN